MTAGPCCVFRATAPPANDAPPDVVAGEGAASDGVASDEVLDEERGGTSSYYLQYYYLPRCCTGTVVLGCYRNYLQYTVFILYTRSICTVVLYSSSTCTVRV